MKKTIEHTVQSKLQTELPKVMNKPEETTLQLTSGTSFKILAITINVHLANLAVPRSFGATARELFRLNGLPDLKLPDNAPSEKLFGAMMGQNTLGNLTTRLGTLADITETMMEEDGSSDEEGDVENEQPYKQMEKKQQQKNQSKKKKPKQQQ